MEKFPKHKNYENEDEKAFKILDALVDAYHRKLPPYDKAVLPQEFKPDRLCPDSPEYAGAIEHSMFFFNICGYMSNRINSEYAFKTLGKMYEDKRDSGLFDPRALAEMSPEQVAETLHEYRMGSYDKVAVWWVENAKRLVERYGGDPRKIFEGAESYEECATRVENDQKGSGFMGFRKKMTSMLIYFLHDEGLIDEINYPLPVDIHALRVFLATDMVESSQDIRNAEFLKVSEDIRNLAMRYTAERGVDPRVVTNACWLLSSNFCNVTPGNRSERGDDGRLNGLVLDTYSGRQMERYWRVCGKCALRGYCKWYVPSGRYYEGKNLIKMPREDAFWAQRSMFEMNDHLD